MIITFLSLSKKGCHGWDRSRDLESRGPAWSRGAVEAQGCSRVFSELVSYSWEGLRASIRIVAYQALREHLVKRDACRPLMV